VRLPFHGCWYIVDLRRGCLESAWGICERWVNHLADRQRITSIPGINEIIRRGRLTRISSCSSAASTLQGSEFGRARETKTCVVQVLQLGADIAQGMAYLHSRHPQVGIP